MRMFNPDEKGLSLVMTGKFGSGLEFTIKCNRDTHYSGQGSYYVEITCNGNEVDGDAMTRDEVFAWLLDRRDW